MTTNDESWKLLLSAATETYNYVCSTNNPRPFTQKLVDLMKRAIKRQGRYDEHGYYRCGYLPSVKFNYYDDLYISPEAIEDIKNWSQQHQKNCVN